MYLTDIDPSTGATQKLCLGVRVSCSFCSLIPDAWRVPLKVSPELQMVRSVALNIFTCGEQKKEHMWKSEAILTFFKIHTIVKFSQMLYLMITFLSFLGNQMQCLCYLPNWLGISSLFIISNWEKNTPSKKGFP